MKKTRRSVAATIAALAICAGLSMTVASPAHALEDWTWSPPVSVGNSDYPYKSSSVNPIVIDAEGRITVLYSTRVGSTSRLVSRSSLNGTDWEDPQLVTPANRDVTIAYVAGNQAGRITALWMDYSGDNPTIWTNTFDGASWLPAAKVTPNEGDYQNPALVVDSTGLITAIWQNSSNCKIESSTSTDGQAWSSVATVRSDAGSCPREPQIVVDDSGRVTAIWWAYDDAPSDLGVLESSTAASPGSWSGVEVLSTVGEDAQSWRLATTADGLAVATWRGDQGSPETDVQSRSSQSGATWSPIYFHGNAVGDDPNVYADPSGTLLLSWEDDDGSWVVSSSDDGRSWSEPVQISLDGQKVLNGAGVQFSSDSCEQTTALWEAQTSDYSLVWVQSSTSANGLDWSTPIDPSGSIIFSSGPRMVEDAQGRVTAVWKTYDPDTDVSSLLASTMTKPACGASPGGGGSLANPGADPTVIGTSLAVSAGLLAAGGLALALMRRRNHGGH